MENEKPFRPPSAAKTVFPLPVALYESNGVIFELYRGAQPDKSPVIRWERLKTFSVSREDLTFHVRVHQAHHEQNSSE